MTDYNVQPKVIAAMIDASKARIETLAAELAEEEQFLAALLKRGGAPSENKGGETSNGKPSSDGDGVEDGGIPQYVVAVLRSAGGKLAMHEIVKRAEEMGATSTAKKGLSAVVASALGRRDDLFVRVRRGVYDLVERRNAATKKQEASS